MIEFSNILKQKINSEVYKLILDCPIKTLAMSIHFGSSGVGMVMDDLLIFEQKVEVSFKLTTIVS